MEMELVHQQYITKMELVHQQCITEMELVHQQFITEMELVHLQCITEMVLVHQQFITEMELVYQQDITEMELVYYQYITEMELVYQPYITEMELVYQQDITEKAGKISFDEAIKNADGANNLRLKIELAEKGESVSLSEGDETNGSAENLDRSARNDPLAGISLVGDVEEKEEEGVDGKAVFKLPDEEKASQVPLLLLAELLIVHISNQT